MKAGMIRVQAYNTSTPLFIPILPPLRAVLEAAPRGDDYCFPSSAQMYLENPDGLTLRFNRILAAVGIISSLPKSSKQVKAQAASKRVGRLRVPSLYGFAACKTTFVSISLTAGIPEMLLRKVVGNQVVDLVLTHYYQIGELELKQQFLGKLPPELTGGQPVLGMPQIVQQMEILLAEVNDQNWFDNIADLRAMLIELKRSLK